MWNVKNKMNTQHRNSLKDTENKVMFAKWKERL